MESRQETKSLFDAAHRNILSNNILINEIATYSADLERQHGREFTRVKASSTN